MRRLLAFALMGLALAAAPAFAITAQQVDYSDGAVTMKGYLAYDEKIAGKRPGILIVHEWWGHNEYARKRAAMLAELGYTALAVDMYGDGKQAMHPDDAGKFAGEVSRNMETMTQRFNAALKFLKSQKTVDTIRVAAIGYCFGGGVVLNMARNGINLRGVASFHGSLATSAPAKKGAVRAKIFVAHGGSDSMIPSDIVEKFKAEMRGANAELWFVEYPGAKHSFTNPDADEYAKKFGLPVAYDKKADDNSWRDLQTFLKKIFRSAGHATRR